MSRAYSEDLRERALVAVCAGRSARAAAARFGIGAATAVRWVRRWRETGERHAHRQGCPKRPMLDPHEAYLFGLVDERPDITLDEMCALLRDARSVEGNARHRLAAFAPPLTLPLRLISRSQFKGVHGFEDLSEIWVRRDTHGSIRIQEAQPTS